MGVTTLLVVIVAGALAVWKLGSIVLRLLGAVLFALGLLGLVLPGSTSVLGGVTISLLGILLWLAGHWLFAFRHHVYRSPLAQRVFLTMLPSRLDPTRNWGVRTLSGDGY